MKEFLLLFRTDYEKVSKASVEQAEAMMKKWMDWLGGIAAQNKLASKGNRLQSSGRIVKSDNIVTNGPYTDIKESIGGYTIIKADNYDEAVEMAKGCPVLLAGGNVEVREIDVI
ncbi:MAG TPA: YciI family protein [Parafilimonas sp.]|nr:YciI family protein [Parafilimonas sp.]